MKKLFYLFQEWRYRRLFRKLFWFYAKKSGDSWVAIRNAQTAFAWLAEFEYKDLYCHFRQNSKSDV